MQSPFTLKVQRSALPREMTACCLQVSQALVKLGLSFGWREMMNYMMKDEAKI
jgi:hypothetical protein